MTRHSILLETPLDNGLSTKAKVFVRTRPSLWVNTEHPVIIPFSIHSAIYEGENGRLKIAAFLHCIKSHVRGKITVLFCEKAHLEVLSLKYNNDRQRAIEVCCQDASCLLHCFKSNLAGCNVEHWVNFVDNDRAYISCKEKISHLFKTSSDFRSLLKKDASGTYTTQRAKEFGDYTAYVNKCELDLLEHCVYLLIASKKKYRFEFYPGRRYESLKFVNDHLLNEQEKLISINVDLNSPKGLN